MNYNGREKLKIDGRDGYYVEKYDIVSKFERCKGKKDLSFSQFAKMYSTAWKKKEKSNNLGVETDEDHNDEEVALDQIDEICVNKRSKDPSEMSNFDFIMKCHNCPDDPNHNLCKMKRTEKLPQYLDLTEVFPGEPPFMRKRDFPAVLRFHKFKEATHPKEYFFSQALLYRPFESEDKLEQEIIAAKIDEEFSNKICCVKSQGMEFLENVEEARFFIEEENRNEEIESLLAPETLQEIDDCEYEGIINHPDYPDLEIEVLEEKGKRFEKTYRIINLDDFEVLLEKTQKLDYFQKKVVEIGVSYARHLVKALKYKNSFSNPPWLTVLGGAGSGKSTVINILKQWIHLILQTSGDSPDCPYVIVAAPTGTAAANVKGQTMDTAFGFSFGNEHYSLSDKKRDEKRTVLQNLRAVLIDEVSMVKSDQLFQLDMRLREVSQKPDKIFGGVAVFDLGDILQ